MQILVDGIIFGRQRFGGISKMWEEFLPRLVNHRVSVKLLVPFRRNNQSLRKLLQNRKNYQISSDYFYWPARYFEQVAVRSGLIEWLYLDDSIDIFHSTYFSTVYDQNVRKVITVYDMIPEKFWLNSKWGAWFVDIKRKTIVNADRIITISQHTRQDILEFYPQLPEDKVSVIHLASSLDNKQSRITWEEVAQKYNLNVQRQAYFLFVGLRSGYKNFQLLVEWVKTHRDWVFVCVGGGKDPLLERQLQEKGLARNFIMLNYVDDETLAALYQNALALVYPSLYEGFGLPILEAMSNRCPVVCSNTSCFPEVAGDAAVYFDPHSIDSFDQAIHDLLGQDREHIIKKGLDNVKRFSWEKSTQALVDVYSSLI